MDPNQQGHVGDRRFHGRYNLAPVAAPMPGHPGYHDSVSLASRPSMPNFLDSGGDPYQYQPHHPGSANRRLPFYDAQEPGSSTGYNNRARARAPLYAHPGADTDFLARDGYAIANNNPYAFARLIAPPASANQGPRGLGPVARPSAQQVRASSLQGLVELARTSGHLEAIVHEVVSDQRRNGVRLMEIASVPRGERALQELVRLVARNLDTEAFRRLFRCLIEGWIMEQSNGPDLLHLFFTMSDYAHCSAIFIHEVVLPRLWDMITSRIGCVSIMPCLESAEYTAQGAILWDTIVTHTAQIARNASGSYFLQAVLQRGRYDDYRQLKEGIRDCVEVHLEVLSTDPWGNDLVRVCFVPNRRWPWVPLLQRGLNAFWELPRERIPDLVRNCYAGRILSDLLLTSVQRDVATDEATRLAVRILGAMPARAQTGAAFRRLAGDLRQRAVELIGSYSLPAR